MRHAGSSSLTRDWTPGPQHWEPGIITTGPPGKSLYCTFKQILVYISRNYTHRHCFAQKSVPPNSYVEDLTARVIVFEDRAFMDVQFSSVAQLCPTLYDPMDCSTPGFPVHHQLLELTQPHVYWVGLPSHPLSSPSPPTFNLSQHQGLFQWVSASHQVAKVLEFQLQHQSFQWIFMNVIKVKLVGSWFNRVNVLIRRDMRGLPWQSSS